jgi:hypothetical protein
LCVEQCNQKLTLGNLVELRKKSTLKEAENPEREPKEMTMTFSQLKEGIRMFQAGSRMLEDTASKVQGSATTILGIMKLFACIEEVLKRTNKPFLFILQSCVPLSHLQEELVHIHLHVWKSKMVTQITYRYMRVEKKVRPREKEVGG